MRRFLWIFLLLLGAIVIFSFSAESPALKGDIYLKEGDVIFIAGRTWRSFFVRLAEKKARGISHVGVVYIKEGNVNVIHASPEKETVQMEPLETFLLSKRVSYAEAMRFCGSGEIAKETARRALRFFEDSVPFDKAFDLHNAEKIYCTELIWRVYQNAAIDLLDDPNVFLEDTKIFGMLLLPGRLSQSSRFQKVEGFQFN